MRNEVQSFRVGYGSLKLRKNQKGRVGERIRFLQSSRIQKFFELFQLFKQLFNLRLHFQFSAGRGVWIFLLLCSCSPNSSEEFQQEGEARCRLLVKELQKIENREQLLVAEPKLKKHFEALIDLIIEAREFQQKQVEDASNEIALRENEAEVILEHELRRIYSIEGGREVVERSQQEALVRLDAYERSLAKKREQLKTRK